MEASCSKVDFRSAPPLESRAAVGQRTRQKRTASGVVNPDIIAAATNTTSPCSSMASETAENPLGAEPARSHARTQ